MSNDEVIKTMLTAVTTDMTEIRNDVKSMNRRVGSLEKLEARDSANLENHMRRTEINEARVDAVEVKLGEEMLSVKTEIATMGATLTQEVQSLKGTVVGWRANIHLLGWVVSVGLVITGLLLRYVI